MVFVELTPFVDFRDEYWTDEDLRALQSFLLVAPDAGDLIRVARACESCVGWRKVAASVAAREDLTPQQIKVLAKVMKDVKDG